MKRLLSSVLALSLLISVLSVNAFAIDEAGLDLKIAVTSDLHYCFPREELTGEINDPIFFYSNRRAAMEDEGGFIIDEFLAQCAADDNCEYILISGDMVNSGRASCEEHKAVAAKLTEFEDRTGKPVFVINGNHDIADGGATDIAKFKEIYARQGYDDALVLDENSGSYTANLGDKYRLIALDSCQSSGKSGDGLTEERMDWVKAQAQSAKDDGRYPILMMHHNLLNHIPLETVFSTNFIVRQYVTVAEKFADWGIKAVFTGHEHASDVAAFTSATGNVIYDFLTSSLTMYPIQYRVVSFSDDSIDYDVNTVDKIDTAALTSQVNGYTPDQIALMNAGFNAYAKGFLKSGLEYRLQDALRADSLGISESEIYYDLVNTALNNMTGLLGMPLYGENSVQTIASKYGMELPESRYTTGWDLVTELLATHYEGNESNTLDSPEVTILLKLVSLILKTELSSVSDEAFKGAAEMLLAQFGTASMADNLNDVGEKVYGNVSAGEYFVLALLSPLLYEFAYDDDGIDDNTGSVPGYGTVSFETNLANIAANVENITSKITLFVSLIMRYVNIGLSYTRK